jgi:hypothetical protein
MGHIASLSGSALEGAWGRCDMTASLYDTKVIGLGSIVWKIGERYS